MQRLGTHATAARLGAALSMASAELANAQSLTDAATAPKPLDQMRMALRKRHCSGWTEKVYVHRILSFIFFHGKRHPPGSADSEWASQWAFPAPTRYFNKEVKIERWHHLHETSVQKAMTQAVLKARIGKPATPHVFRHSSATHLLEGGSDIRTVQEPLGHKGVKTRMLCTHMLNSGPAGVRSPADPLLEAAVLHRSVYHAERRIALSCDLSPIKQHTEGTPTSARRAILEIAGVWDIIQDKIHHVRPLRVACERSCSIN